MAKETSQPEQRSYRSFRDKHGREWGSAIDKRTGHSVGPWEPQFQAPWLPEAKYIRHDPKDDRYIILDYDRNVRDLREAHDAYDEMRLKRAMDEYGSAFTSKLGRTHEEDPPELKKLVGKPPNPIQYPEAAAEDNKWVLGLSSLIPKWAYPLIEAAAVVERKYIDAEDEVNEMAIQEADRKVDLDEEFDPEATGGKRVPVKTSGFDAYQEFLKQHKGLPQQEINTRWKAHKAQKALALTT